MLPPDVSIWTDPPVMSRTAPGPDLERRGDDLWVAYRTHRGDHFAVLRFTQVQDFRLGDPTDEPVDRRPVSLAGLEAYGFYEVTDPGFRGSELRRWVVTFPDATLDLTARRADIVIRAVQALSATHALAALST